MGRYPIAEWAVLAKYLSEPLPDQLKKLATGFALESAYAGSDADRVVTLTAAARILAMLHEALCRNDRATLMKWEKIVYGYAPEPIPLPPRAGLSRADVVRKLVAVAREDIANPHPPSRDRIGCDMADAVQGYFPHLQHTDTGRKTSHAEKAARIVDAWEAMNHAERSDPELLAVEALVAFGVSRSDAHNWIKGAV